MSIAYATRTLPSDVTQGYHYDAERALGMIALRQALISDQEGVQAPKRSTVVACRWAGLERFAPGYIAQCGTRVENSRKHQVNLLCSITILRDGREGGLVTSRL